jgi:hypothetical protein
MQKGKPLKKDLPLLKNDITGSELVLKLKIYSRNQKVGSGCDIVLWYHRKIRSLIVGSYCRYHQPYWFNNHIVVFNIEKL